MDLEQRKPAETLTQLYLGAMLGVFLLFPGFDGYRNITEDKFLLLCVLSGGYGVLSLVFALRDRMPGGIQPEAGWVRKLMALYLLWAVLATVCSVAPVRSLWGGPRREGLVSLAMYVGTFLLISRRGRARRWQLWLFALSVSLCCALALVQLAGFNPLGLYPPGMTYYDGNVRYGGQFLGTIGNVGLLAGVLCIAIPMFWTGILRLEGKKRFWLLLPLGLSLVVLFTSRVDAGIVSVFGGALLTLPVVLRGNCRKKAAVTVAAVMVVLFIVVYLFGEHLPGFLYEANRVLHGRAEDTFGSGRIYIWRSVMPLLRERPLLGGGPETLGLRGEILFERFDSELGMMLRSYVDTAHNEYLNVAVEMGVPALVCYLGALICGTVFWVKKSPESPAAAICGAGVMGYCIQAFFGISSVVSAPFFWIALGLLVAA